MEVSVDDLIHDVELPGRANSGTLLFPWSLATIGGTSMVPYRYVPTYLGGQVRSDREGRAPVQKWGATGTGAHIYLTWMVPPREVPPTVEVGEVCMLPRGEASGKA